MFCPCNKEVTLDPSEGIEYVEVILNYVRDVFKKQNVQVILNIIPNNNFSFAGQMCSNGIAFGEISFDVSTFSAYGFE